MSKNTIELCYDCGEPPFEYQNRLQCMGKGCGAYKSLPKNTIDDALDLIVIGGVKDEHFAITETVELAKQALYQDLRELAIPCDMCDGACYFETGGTAMEDDLVEKEPCDSCQSSGQLIPVEALKQYFGKE